MKNYNNTVSHWWPTKWKSKIDRLTFVFPFFYRRLKIYQAANSTQASFIKRAIYLPILAGYFHPITYLFNKYILADWVEGVTCDTLSISEKYQVINWISDLQCMLHSIKLCEKDEQAGFSYMDYLEKRIVRFSPPDQNLDQIKQLRKIASSHPVNESRLSHPDVTLRNIVKNNNSGKFILVDNELLSQSPYFLLDIFNTCYNLAPSSELTSYYLDRYSCCQGDFSLQPEWISSLSAAWALRIAGSNFQDGLFQEGRECLDNWDKGYGEILTSLQRKQTSNFEYLRRNKMLYER